MRRIPARKCAFRMGFRVRCETILIADLPPLGLTMFLTASCPVCGDELRRTKRSLRERIRYSAVYSCRYCQHREYISRLDVLKVSRHARCPECQNSSLHVLKRRDYIDRYNRNPFRLLQKLMGAHLYHCGFCRLQFYDLRALQSRSKEWNPRLWNTDPASTEETTKAYRP